jgi:hypothetical protein
MTFALALLADRAASIHFGSRVKASYNKAWRYVPPSCL